MIEGRISQKLSFWRHDSLLDKVLVISRTIKVEVGVISRSRRLRLITLTETLITLDITKTESNNCFIIHWTKKLEVTFLLFHWRQATQSARTWHEYPWPWVFSTWLFYDLQRWRHRRWFRKFTVRFWPIRKEMVSSMYNISCNLQGYRLCVKTEYIYIRWLTDASSINYSHWMSRVSVVRIPE